MQPRVLVSLVAVLFLAAVPPVRAWETSLVGTPPDARPFGLGVDANGNVFTGGRTPSGSSSSDGIAAKLSAADGSILWQRDIVGTAAGNDIVRALVMDASGKPIVIRQGAGTTTRSR